MSAHVLPWRKGWLLWPDEFMLCPPRASAVVVRPRGGAAGAAPASVTTVAYPGQRNESCMSPLHGNAPLWLCCKSLSEGHRCSTVCDMPGGGALGPTRGGPAGHVHVQHVIPLVVRSFVGMGPIK